MAYEEDEKEYIVPLDVARMRIQISYNELDGIIENLSVHPSLLLMFFREERHFSSNQRDLIKKKCSDLVPTCLLNAAMNEKDSGAIKRIMECFDIYDNFQLMENHKLRKRFIFLNTFYDILCYSNHVEIVKFLCEEKDIPRTEFTKNSPSSKMSPFDIAVVNENVEVCKLLLPKSVNSGEVVLDMNSDVVRRKVRASLMMERVKSMIDKDLEYTEDLLIEVEYLDQHPPWPYQFTFEKRSEKRGWKCRLVISGSSHRMSTNKNFFQDLRTGLLSNFLYHKYSHEHILTHFEGRVQNLFGLLSDDITLCFDFPEFLKRKRSILRAHEVTFSKYEASLGRRLSKVVERIKYMKKLEGSEVKEEEEVEGEEEENEEEYHRSRVQKNNNIVKFKKIRIKLGYGNEDGSSKYLDHEYSDHSLRVELSLSKMEDIRLQRFYDRLCCIFLKKSTCEHILSYMPQKKFLSEKSFHIGNQKCEIELYSVLRTKWKGEMEKKSTSTLKMVLEGGRPCPAQLGDGRIELAFERVGKYKILFYQESEDFFLGAEEVELFTFDLSCQKREVVGHVYLQLKEFRKVGKFMREMKFYIPVPHEEEEEREGEEEDEKVYFPHSFDANNGKIRVMFHEEHTKYLKPFEKFTLFALVNDVFTSEVNDLAFISSSSITDRLHFLLEDLGVARQQGGQGGRLNFLGGTRSISVSRDELLESSLRQIRSISNHELLKNRLSIRFNNEPGSDAGGLRRSWISLLFRDLVKELLVYDEETKTTRFKKLSSSESDTDYSKHHFFGRIVAKNLASQNCVCIQGNLSLILFKNLLDEEIKLDDLEKIDMELNSFFKKIKSMEASQIKDMELSFTRFDRVLMEEVELVPNGENFPVTRSNLKSFFEKYVENKYDVKTRKERMSMEEKEFQKGFYSLIPKEKLLKHSVRANDLYYLLEGNLKKEELGSVDLYSLMKYSKDSGVSGEDFEEMKEWWRQILEKPESVKFLKNLLFFFTGCFFVPSQGFESELQVRFNTNDVRGFRLPTAHTCAHQISIPLYQSREEFQKALKIVCDYGFNGYGFS